MRAFNAPSIAAALIIATNTSAFAGVNTDAQLCRDAIVASSDIDASSYRVKFESAKGGRIRVLRFMLSPSTDGGQPLNAICTIERGAVSKLEFTAEDE